MRKEYSFWNKRFVVLRPLSDLLRPGSIALSETNSSGYRNSGTGRKNEHKDIMVFQYTLSGHGVFEFEGERRELPPGRGFFCNVTDRRVCYFYQDEASQPWQFLYITIIDPAGTLAFINKQLGFIFDIDPTEPQIKHLLSYGSVPEVSIQLDAGVAHVFASSLVGMIVDQSQRDMRKRNPALSVVQKGLAAIEKAINEPLNAAMLAKRIGVSQEYLNRAFRAELDCTPYQYICEAKMQRACELLKNTSENIATVAMQLGYQPDSHFSRLFKRVIGITPSQFRNGVSMPIRRSWHSLER